MSKKQGKKGWMKWLFVGVLLALGLGTFLLVRPYFSWRTYVNDDLGYSLMYPAKWYIQASSNGKQVLMADVVGNLSSQDRISKEQRVLLEIFVYPRSNIEKDFSEQVATRIKQFGGENAVLVKKYQLNGKSTVKISARDYNEVSRRLLMIDLGDQILEVHGAIYKDLSGLLGVFYREMVIDRVLDSFEMFR